MLGLVGGLGFAAIQVAAFVIADDGADVAVVAVTGFVVYATCATLQARKLAPTWPAGLSYGARRRATWAVRRGEAVESPEAATGVVAVAASVQRAEQSPRERWGWIALAVVALLYAGFVASAVDHGSTLGVAGASFGLAVIVAALARYPGALRRLHANAATALAAARRALGEPA